MRKLAPNEFFQLNKLFFLSLFPTLTSKSTPLLLLWFSTTIKLTLTNSFCVAVWSNCSSSLTHLLDVLQRNPVLPELLVDEDEGVEEAHPPVEQLVRQLAQVFHHSLVILQQSERAAQETQNS